MPENVPERSKWKNYGNRIRILKNRYRSPSGRKTTYEDLAEKISGAINSEITWQRLRSWVRGVQPPPQAKEYLDSLMNEYNIPSILEQPAFTSLGDFPLRVYKEVLPLPDLESLKNVYEGNYICFYDEGQVSNGKRTLFTRNYNLSQVDLHDGSLYGDFSTGGSSKGAVKFVFSPSNANRSLIYLIELAEARNYPTVSGIVRAVEIHNEQIGNQVYFSGVLTGFRHRAQGPIIAVRCLILKLDQVQKSICSDLPEEISEELFKGDTWKLLRYYFNGVHPIREENCVSCLWVPERLRILLSNNQIHYVNVDDLVEAIYQGEMRGTMMASDKINLFDAQDKMIEEQGQRKKFITAKL